LSPDNEGLKSTLKKGNRTSLGSTFSNKTGLESGRFYEGSLPKVSFDFSNLELKNMQGPRTGIMEEDNYTRDPSISNLRQQDQPIYYAGK
jgi:hypothetical protein